MKPKPPPPTPSTPGSRYRRIYTVVSRIPSGRVATYGQVAELAGVPGQPRLVGYALHALPQGSAVPWHRVINRMGRISLPPLAGGTEQRIRLAAEGVEVNEGGGIRLNRYLWRPPTRSRPHPHPVKAIR